MRIKSLYIEGFGKLNDFTCVFDDEVNIIRFNNEYGKTTIAEFIRAMLYGMNSGVRNIKNNPRKKYMPWGKSAMGGELLVEADGRQYLIIRTFGDRKGSDKINVIDNVTGETIEKFCTDCPFYEMTGVGADAFDKALYITHLSVDMDSKRDEITDKLVALSQSGDEEFSYRRACKVLDDAIKELNGAKNGKIVETKEKINRCYKDLKENRDILESAEYIKAENKSLEQQEQSLRAEGDTPLKKYCVLWAAVALLSVALYFIKPWLTALGLVILAGLIAKAFISNKKYETDKITRLMDISKEIGINKGKLQECKSIDLKHITEKIQKLEKQLSCYENKLSDLVIARQALDDAFNKIQQGFGTRLNESVAEILNVITDGSYDGVKADKNFEMLVHCKYGWQSAQYLSDGAYSQIYFALKMAIVKILFDKMPLILDDPFVLYDEKRLMRAMEYLSNCDNHIILFTR